MKPKVTMKTFKKILRLAMKLNKLLYLFDTGGYWKGERVGVIIVQANRARQRRGATFIYCHDP
jgi:hypothetical protein